MIFWLANGRPTLYLGPLTIDLFPREGAHWGRVVHVPGDPDACAKNPWVTYGLGPIAMAWIKP